MPSDCQNRGPHQFHWFLRRADQAAVAMFVFAGLAATIAWWSLRGGVRGGMVELERAEFKTARFEVDINTADWPELLQLPEIGETLAKRIVDSRRNDGPFRDQRDLMRVRGIGPRTFNTIKPYLRPMPDQNAMAQK
jgi:competence protein ComEA